VDLAKYEELTGTTVATGDIARYTAIINRANASLSSLLGYPLDSTQNLDIEELGKVQFEGQYPYYPIDPTKLLPPDTQTGTYKLFPYNESDIFLPVDPFTNAYHVKLVQRYSPDKFVTFTTLSDWTQKNTSLFGKYIERQVGWFIWGWYTWLIENLGKDNGLLLAIDGDWLDQDSFPLDLMYLWTDMVTYYTSDEVSVIGNIKSESVNGHSWSRANAGGGNASLAPEQTPTGLKILAQYAGPNGTLATRIPTV
jgi:hypothetical protein